MTEQDYINGTYPSPKSDEEALFSLSRAKRGAKIGAGISLGLTAFGVAAATAENGIEILTEPETLVALAEYALTQAAIYGAVGAVIDGFRPTSKLFKWALDSHINIVKDIKQDLSSLYHNLPTLEFHPRRIFERPGVVYLSTAFGAATAGLLYSLTYLEKFVVGSDPLGIRETIINNPAAVIWVGATAGFLVTAAGISTIPEDSKATLSS